MAGLQSATIQAASRGMDVNAAAAYVAPDRAPLVQNLLPGRTGRLLLRGGAHTKSASVQITGSGIVAPWTFDNKVLLPYNGTVGSPQPNGTVVEMTNATFIYTSFTATGTTLRLTFPSYARVGSYVFGVGMDSTLFSGANTILRWDGTSNTNALVGYANAPTATLGTARAVISHLNRLFVLTNAAATPGSLPTLYWSIDGGPTTDTAAAWQDPATGLTNQIKLDYTGEVERGLAHVGRNLLILRSESLWMLTGDSPDSFALRRVSSIGCRATSAICEYNDGVFFAGNDGGFWFFDGSTTTRVSTPIEGYDPGVPAGGPQFSWITRLNDECLFMTTAVNPMAVSSSDRAYIYHVPTGSWSQFTSAAMPNLPSWVGRTTDYSYAVSTTKPPTGFPIAQVWDISKLGRANDSANPTPSPGYDSIDSGGSLIPARLTTRMLKLGSPELKAQINRFLADYDLSTNGSPPTAGIQWNVTAKDDLGTTLFTAALPAVANPGRQRISVDQFAEVSKAMQLDVTLGQTGGGVQVLSTAELEDLSVVYQVTRP